MPRLKPPRPPEESPQFLLSALRWKRSWFAAAALLWCGLVLWNYAGPDRVPYFALTLWMDYVPPFWQMTGEALLSHFKHLAQLLVFTSFSVWLGRGVLMRTLEHGSLNPLEMLAFSHALGLGLLGFLMFFLAAFGLMRPYAVWTAAAAVLGLSIYLNRGQGRPNASEWKKVLRAAAPHGASWPAAALCAAALLLSGFYALGEDIFYDALVYHLALPSLYKLEGGLVPTLTNLYSGIPMLFEMLYGWTLFISQAALSSLLHWSAFLSSAIAIVALGLRTGRPRVGWWAAMIFLSAPFVGDASHRSGVEGGSILWVLTALYASAMSLQDDRQAGRWAALGGLFAGFAMASKYTNWPFAVVLLASLAVLGQPARRLAILAAAALLCVAPWVVKNLVCYNNPIFPFFHDMIAPASAFPVDWRTLQADAKGRDWGFLLNNAGELARTILHPWHLTLEGKTDHDTLGPIFLVLLLLPVGFRFVDRAGRLFAWAAVGLWCAWWPFSALPRFFMPGLAVLSILESAALWSCEPAWLRRGLLGMVLLLAAGNVTDSAIFSSRLGQWPLLLGRQAREDYLMQERPTYPAPIQGAFKWINENSRADARILMIGDGRAYHLNRRFLSNTLIDRSYFFHALSKSRTAEELSRALRDEGITHLVVNMAWLAKLRPPDDRSGAAASVLREFMSHWAALRHEERDLSAKRWNFVYELSPAAGDWTAQADYLSAWFSRRR